MGKGNHFHPRQRPNASLSDGGLPSSLDGFDSEKSIRNRGPVLYFVSNQSHDIPLLYEKSRHINVYIYILCMSWYTNIIRFLLHIYDMHLPYSTVRQTLLSNPFASKSKTSFSDSEKSSSYIASPEIGDGLLVRF